MTSEHLTVQLTEFKFQLLPVITESVDFHFFHFTSMLWLKRKLILKEIHYFKNVYFYKYSIKAGFRSQWCNHDFNANHNNRSPTWHFTCCLAGDRSMSSSLSASQLHTVNMRDPLNRVLGKSQSTASFCHRLYWLIIIDSWKMKLFTFPDSWICSPSKTYFRLCNNVRAKGEVRLWHHRKCILPVDMAIYWPLKMITLLRPVFV